MMQQQDLMARFVTVGLDGWRVSLKVAETMVASQAVIASRLSMLVPGLMHPGRLPVAEFSRLVPEKTAAFGKAGLGATRALRAGQAAAPGGMAALDWWETSIKAADAWWSPIHAQAMANARRLA